MAKRKLVNTSTLRKGMKIEQAIVDAHGHEMIARGMVLDDFQIEYLRQGEPEGASVSGLRDDG